MVRILVVIVVLVAAGLAATNPPREKFEDWIRGFVTQKVEAEARKQGQNLDGDNKPWAEAIVELWVVHMAVERRNLLLFSIYDIELPPEGQSNGERTCEILGIAGQFVPLGGC